MSIRERRLEKGWSQGQLAEFSGLSLRTIQRIERGQKPTLESMKALASVFETDLPTLAGEFTPRSEIDESLLTDEEFEELERVRSLRKLVYELLSYFTTVPLLMLLNYLTFGELHWSLWVAFGWGAWIVWELFDVFDAKNLLGGNWDKRQLEKRLGRKLP